MKKITALIGITLVLVTVLILPPLVRHLTMGWINQIFESRTAKMTQADAIEASWKSLIELGRPNVALVLSQDTIAPLVEQAARIAIEGEGFDVAHVSAELGQQSVKIAADISGKLREPDIGLKGSMTGSVAIATTAGEISLVPTFDGVILEELSVAGYQLPGPLSRAAGAGLDAALGAINARIKPATIPTPAALVKADTVQLGGQSLNIPDITISGAAFLIENSQLSWLAALDTGVKLDTFNSSVAIEGVPAEPKFVGFAKAFQEAGGSLLAGLGDEGIRLAPEFVAGILGPLYAPGSPEERAEAALEAARNAAVSMAGPDLSLSIPTATIRAIVEPMIRTAIEEEFQKAGVRLNDVTIEMLDGALALHAFAEADLKDPGPSMVRFQIGFSVSPVIQGADLMLRPGLEEIEILSAESEVVDTAIVLAAINRLLAALAAGLDAALPSVPVEFEPLKVKEIDLNVAMDKAAAISFEPSVIPAMQFQIERIAALLTPPGLNILVDFKSNAKALKTRTTASAPADVPTDRDTIAELFTISSMGSAAVSNAERANSEVIQGALAWRRLAELVNAGWEDLGGIRAGLAFDTGRMPFEPTKIELVERPNYECNRDRKCSFDSSCANSCSRDNCDYGCPSIGTNVPCPTFAKPFRFCYKSVEEPGCVAGREVCKAGREAKYGACVLACNTEANLKKADCDRLAEMEVAGCKLGAAIQDVGAEIGGVGSISGDIRATGSARVDTAALLLNPSSFGLHFNPKFAGNVKIDGSIDFVPYDIIGNLMTCPKGKLPFSSLLTVPQQQPAVAVELVEDPEPDENDGLDDLDLLMTIEPFAVRAKIDPPPVNMIFDQNPHLIVICNPIIGAAVAGLRVLGEVSALAGSDLIRAASGTEAAAILTGDVRYNAERTEVPLSIEHPRFRLGEHQFALTPRLAESAILLTAKPADN